LPVLGLQQQRLGYVHRLFLSLATRKITQVELRTPWQTLWVGGDAIRFDERRRVFFLVSRKRTKSPGLREDL
jgi:hypothetical protein